MIPKREKGAKDLQREKSQLGLTIRRWSELRQTYSKCDGVRARPAIFLLSGHLLNIFPLEGDPRKGKTGNKPEKHNQKQSAKVLEPKTGLHGPRD